MVSASSVEGLQPASQLKLNSIPPPANADAFRNDLLLMVDLMTVMKLKFYVSVAASVWSICFPNGLKHRLNLIVSVLQIIYKWLVVESFAHVFIQCIGHCGKDRRKRGLTQTGWI